MKKLFELAEMINDKELRKKVLDVLKNPTLTNKKFKYKAAKFKDAPASTNWHHIDTGGLVQHTYAVTLLSIKVAEIFRDVYKVNIDFDSLIAAALVHDIGKVWSMKKDKVWTLTELTLDHTMLGTSELYARGFPEKVIHIVASHFGENGPTPPQTIEAMLFHYVDNMDAVLNGYVQDSVIQLLLDTTEKKSK